MNIYSASNDKLIILHIYGSISIKISQKYYDMLTHAVRVVVFVKVMLVCLVVHSTVCALSAAHRTVALQPICVNTSLGA